jgi:hypothetical protein
MVAIGGGFAGVNGDKYVDDPATHRRVELYDPSTGRWTLGPAQQGRRVYHSTAVLLPDGSVMSGGDDGDGDGGGGASDLIEIYEPPYLRQGGTRPVITSAPAPSRTGAGSRSRRRTPTCVARS